MPYIAYSQPKGREVWEAVRVGFEACEADPAWTPGQQRKLFRNGTVILGGLDFDQPALLKEVRAPHPCVAPTPYVFIDAGYMATHIAGRRARYRVVPNAYNQHWLVPATPARFNALGLSIAPWRKTGREILICTSSDTHAEFFGLQSWVQRTAHWVGCHTDRPIVRRDKAAARRGDLPPFAEALKSAWAVIAWSSAVATEAALAGVPVFTGPESAALPVSAGALDRIEYPLYPDNREAWAWSLADAQFTVEEIASGQARRHEVMARSYRPEWLAARHSAAKPAFSASEPFAQGGPAPAGPYGVVGETC